MKDDIDAKERDRQYHMDAINRLASFLAFHGTSFEVVQAAIDNMSRMKNELEMVRRDRDYWKIKDLTAQLMELKQTSGVER